MITRQLSIPGVFDPSLPLEVSGADLAATIAQVEQAGLCIRRMDVHGTRYTLHLQRASSTRAAMDRRDEPALAAWAIVLDIEERLR